MARALPVLFAEPLLKRFHLVLGGDAVQNVLPQVGHFARKLLVRIRARVRVVVRGIRAHAVVVFVKVCVFIRIVFKLSLFLLNC